MPNHFGGGGSKGGGGSDPPPHPTPGDAELLSKTLGCPLQGGGDIMHARALDYAMPKYAQLCTIMRDAFQRRHKGIANKRDPATATLLSFGSRRDTTFLILRRWKNFIVLQSIFSSGNICRCILVDKRVHDKHNNELHWTTVKQKIMHDYVRPATPRALEVV